MDVLWDAPTALLSRPPYLCEAVITISWINWFLILLTQPEAADRDAKLPSHSLMCELEYLQHMHDACVAFDGQNGSLDEVFVCCDLQTQVQIFNAALRASEEPCVQRVSVCVFFRWADFAGQAVS